MIGFTVNGQSKQLDAGAEQTLQEVLQHRLGLTDVRRGCGDGACGACTVLVDGAPKASCLMLAAQAVGHDVVTAAGLYAGEGCEEALTAACRAFVERAPFQCGYCASGMSVTGAHHIVHGEASIDSAREALSGHLCRCTGYQQLVYALADIARGTIAQPHFRRNDIASKVTGQTPFPTDARRPALVGRILWSAYPSAGIQRIDVRSARLTPGVVSVLTHADVPGCNRMGPSTFGSDQPLLAEDHVRSMGDAVALVAAETNEAAADAIARIDVSYAPKPPVSNFVEAASPTSPRIGRRNTIAQIVEGRGDVAAAFARAVTVVEGTYETGANDHACIELDGGTGWMDGETVVLEVPHQTPVIGQVSVARMLGIPRHRVRIQCTNLGGSFGKYALTSVEGYLALLVHTTRRAVRLVLEREEVLQRRPKRHPSHGHYKLGLNCDGTFAAIAIDVVADAGAYVGLTPAVAAVIGGEASGAYTIPHVAARVRGVLSNNLVTTPMRGYGSQQASFGVEAIVDRAAHEIGMDPIALRLLNLRSGYERNGREPLRETLVALQQRLGSRPESRQQGSWLHGRGVAVTHAKYGYPFGVVDRFVVAVRVDVDGEFTVESDLSDSGTGVTTLIAEVVREAFDLPGLPRYKCDRRIVDDPSGRLFTGRPPSWLWNASYRMLEWVQVGSARTLFALTANMKPTNVRRLARAIARPTNVLAGALNGLKSAAFPFSRDSFQPRFGSSRWGPLAAQATLDAVAKLRAAAIAAAAAHLTAKPAEFEVGRYGVRVRGSARAMTWAQIARTTVAPFRFIGEAHNPKGTLLDEQTGNQSGAVDYMDAAHGCDLWVDANTGSVRIDRYVACHDVGHVLDLTSVTGQILGGTAMGIGQALFERLETSEGRVLNRSLRDYLVPTSLDIPEIDVAVIESGTGVGPRGAKGVGESAAVAAPIAVANAVYDATGVQPAGLPLTADILMTIARNAITREPAEI